MLYMIHLIRLQDGVKVKLHFFTGLFYRPEERPLRALQVEVTSRCTRSCALCPRHDLAHDWRDGDLQEDVWKVIEPDLVLAEHVHLQGWGEPLLHPMLPVWAAQAHEAGCTVGITTNGDLLDRASDWILDGHIELVTVSVAGAHEMNKSLRGGSNLDKVLRAAGNLAAQSRKRRLRMKVKMSFLLTRKNAPDLLQVIEFASRAGLDEVFVTHLDCRTSKFLYDQSAFNGDHLLPEIVDVLKAAALIARRAGIRFRGPTLGGEEVLACALNPLHFTFISWDGRVGPCVNLLFPLDNSIPRWSEKGEARIEPVVYGRLGRSTLATILSSKERERFVLPFRERLAAEKRFVSAVDFEPSMRTLEALAQAEEKREKALHDHPLPNPCSGCPKAFGW